MSMSLLTVTPPGGQSEDIANKNKNNFLVLKWIDISLSSIVSLDILFISQETWLNSLNISAASQGRRC